MNRGNEKYICTSGGFESELLHFLGQNESGGDVNHGFRITKDAHYIRSAVGGATESAETGQVEWGSQN